MANYNQMLQRLINKSLLETDSKSIYVRENDHSAIIGPISRDTLKVFLDDSDLPEHFEIKSGTDDKWYGVYSHTYFQRRKPQLLSSVDFQKQTDIFVLVEGEKKGPYSPEEIRTFVNNKEIILTDEVSFDGGESWSKLYQVDEFDRRSLLQQPLPNSPEWEVFNESYNEVDQSLGHKSEESAETDAIAGLAFFEKIKNGNKEASDKDINDLNFGDSSAPKQKNKMVANFMWTFLFIFSAFGTYTILTNPKDAGLAKLQKEIDKENKQNNVGALNRNSRKPASAPVVHGSPINRVKSRAAVRRQPRSRKPTSRSFRSSDTFKNRFSERRMEDSPFEDERDERDEYEDDYNYDDDTDPVQNDPVRSKVSRETLDPNDNDDYYDDADELEGERIPAAEESSYGDVISGNSDSASGENVDELFDEEQEY